MEVVVYVSEAQNRKRRCWKVEVTAFPGRRLQCAGHCSSACADGGLDVAVSGLREQLGGRNFTAARRGDEVQHERAEHGLRVCSAILHEVLHQVRDEAVARAAALCGDADSRQ
jgi:hypothetical protein